MTHNKEDSKRKPPKVQCRPLIGHQATIKAATLHNDLKTIYSASDDNSLRIWDFELCSLLSTKMVRTRAKDGVITGIRTSSDRIACTTDTGHILMLDINNPIDHPQRCQVTKQHIGKIAFSDDGGRICLPCSDNTTYVYDVKTNIIVQRLLGHTSKVTCATFANDSRYCLTTSLDKRSLYWDLRFVSGPVSCITLPYPAFAVTCANNGLIVLSGMSNSVRVYDRGLCTPLWVSVGHGAWPTTLVSSDTEYVYSLADYDGIGEINTMTGELKILCATDLETVFDMRLLDSETIRVVGLPHEEELRNYRNVRMFQEEQIIFSQLMGLEGNAGQQQVEKTEYIKAWQSQTIVFQEPPPPIYLKSEQIPEDNPEAVPVEGDNLEAVPVVEDTPEKEEENRDALKKENDTDHEEGDVEEVKRKDRMSKLEDLLKDFEEEDAEDVGSLVPIQRVRTRRDTTFRVAPLKKPHRGRYKRR